MALFRRSTTSVASMIAAPSIVATPMADAEPRQPLVVAGQVTHMRARPIHGVPALAVTVSDGTASVVAVWTGRRALGGVTLGRRIALEGVAIRHANQLEFTNPRYTLLPADHH
jgi:RecG-like helicase